MQSKKRRCRWLNTVLFLAFAGCASTSRGCSSCMANHFGADWVVVQMDNEGRPYRCWELRDVSIDGESNDGIVWKDTSSGNLVHVMGHLNRVQVTGGNWDHAYHELGLTKKTCEEVRDATYDPVSRTFSPLAPAAPPAPVPPEKPAPSSQPVGQ